MNQQPLVTPSPFAVAPPAVAAPFSFMSQQQQQQVFGGGFGGGAFGFSGGNPFGSAAAAPFAPAAAAAAPAAAAAAAADNGQSPMVVQKETKAEHYSEGKIYVEAWKHLQTAKKSGCWPFTSIGAGPAAEAIFEGLVFGVEELRWEFYQKTPEEQQVLMRQVNEKLYNLQREFYLKVKVKAAAERLPLDLDMLYEAPAAAPPPVFPAAAAAGIPGGILFNAAVPAQLNFGAAPAAAAAAPAAPAAPAAAPAAATAMEEAMQAFRSAAFQPGCIPEVPPPPELCG
ncbi:hypothetical protein Esti_005633 [Eimeria stiedai]